MILLLSFQNQIDFCDRSEAEKLSPAWFLPDLPCNRSTQARTLLKSRKIRFRFLPRALPGLALFAQSFRLRLSFYVPKFPEKLRSCRPKMLRSKSGFNELSGKPAEQHICDVYEYGLRRRGK
jgi:hypothetical protein